MSISTFLQEADSYITNRKNELSRSIEILESLSSGIDSAYSSLKSKLLNNIESIISTYGSFSDNSNYFDAHVTGIVDGIISGQSADEAGLRQSRGVIATLGSILAGDKTTPHYIAKKTADELYYKLSDRTAVLDDISYYLDKVKQEISNIDTNWYSNYLNDTTNALNEVNNAIENLLTVRSFIYNQNAINITKIDLVKTNAESAIAYLSRENTPVSVLNIVRYTQYLYELVAKLQLLDSEIDLYIDNLINFKSNFNDASSSGNRFIAYIRESADKQYDDLVYVKDTMTEVLSRKDARLAMQKSSDWIRRLATVSAISDEQIIDFGEMLNDSSNSETTKLDSFINNLSSRELNTELSSSLNSTIGKVIQIINIDIDKSSVISDIDNSINDVSNDSSESRLVMADCSDYEPNPVEALDEFIRYIETLNLDRLKYVLLSSKWGDIFSLVENGLTHAEVISALVMPFIDDIDDDELRNAILALTYKLQTERRINRIKAITFSTAKQWAINSLRTKEIKDIEKMAGQLESIKIRLER